MTLFEAFLYGAVQGLTEYLPVSSSAHLILVPRFLGSQDSGLTFDVFLHAGTLASTLIYFRKEWARVFRQAVNQPFQTGEQNLFLLIAIATLPALIAGALAHKWISTVLRGNGVLTVTLATGGILLWAADYWRQNRAGNRISLGSVGVREAIGVGIAQCFALIPGMSRSGSTMIGGRLLGLDRDSAARFSFLLSAPITAAALIFELRHWRELVSGSIGAGALVVGGISSFVFGWLAIDLLLRLVRRFGYLAFALYRLLLAFVVYRVLVVG